MDLEGVDIVVVSMATMGSKNETEVLISLRKSVGEGISRVLGEFSLNFDRIFADPYDPEMMTLIRERLRGVTL